MPDRALVPPEPDDFLIINTHTLALKMEVACTPEISAILPTSTLFSHTGTECTSAFNHCESLRSVTLTNLSPLNDFKVNAISLICTLFVALAPDVSSIALDLDTIILSAN